MTARDIHETPIDHPPDDRTLLLLLRQDVRGVKSDIDELREALDTKYVTQDQFWPVKTLVYSAVGIALALLVAGIVGLVIANKESIKGAMRFDGKADTTLAQGWQP